MEVTHSLPGLLVMTVDQSFRAYCSLCGEEQHRRLSGAAQNGLPEPTLFLPSLHRPCLARPVLARPSLAQTVHQMCQPQDLRAAVYWAGWYDVVWIKIPNVFMSGETCGHGDSMCMLGWARLGWALG